MRIGVVVEIWKCVYGCQDKAACIGKQASGRPEAQAIARMSELVRSRVGGAWSTNHMLSSNLVPLVDMISSGVA